MRKNKFYGAVIIKPTNCYKVYDSYPLSVMYL